MVLQLVKKLHTNTKCYLCTLLGCCCFVCCFFFFGGGLYLFNIFTHYCAKYFFFVNLHNTVITGPESKMHVTKDQEITSQLKVSLHIDPDFIVVKSC